MRKATAFFAAAAVASGLLLTACGKEESPDTGKNPVSLQQTAAGSEQSAEKILTAVLDKEDTTADFNKESAVKITFSEAKITAAGEGVSVDGAVVTISRPGTYYITGSLQEGQLHVNSAGEGTVRLIWGGMSISNSQTAPVYVEEADKVIVTLEEGTVNTLTDKARSTAELEDLSAALYSKADTVINGAGTLTISAGFNDGITSKDDLKIVGGNIRVTAADDGIVGKDLLQITGGNITVHAQGDGMKSTYDTDTSRGNILITAGTFEIEAKKDGIQSENMLQVDGGSFKLVTGSGSTNAAKASNNMNGVGGRGGMQNPWQNPNQNQTGNTDSLKGLKAVNELSIYGGTFEIDSEDDAIHTNKDVYIRDGVLTLASGDDGIHADGNLTVDGGSIEITTSYEGLEASVITINGGNHQIKASDDGLNAAGGDSADSFAMGHTGNSQSSSAYQLIINGGSLYVNADGDGLDSNGTITVTGGTVFVDGPVNNNNGAIDYENQMTVTGGVLIAAGSSGMAQGPTTAEGVVSTAITFAQSQPGGAVFTLKDASGKTIVEYTPSKNYSHIVVITPEISSSGSYTAYVNGNETMSFTTTGSINNVSSSGSVTGGSGMPGGNPGGMRPDGGGMKGERDDGISRPENMQKPDNMQIPDNIQRPENRQ